MIRRIFAASHERGIQLIAAGCPLDYPEALPGHPAARGSLLRAEQVDGYAESCVYLLGPMDIGFVIGLRLGTDRPSGTTIAEWSFEPPWPDLSICWDYEAQDIVPKRDHAAYASLFDSRLMGVLNEHRLLQRGYPVEGLLCGCAHQPIPESGDCLVSAKLNFVDDEGIAVALRVALTVVRPAATRSKRLPTHASSRSQR